jgi:hypothetical protein
MAGGRLPRAAARNLCLCIVAVPAHVSNPLVGPGRPKDRHTGIEGRHRLLQPRRPSLALASLASALPGLPAISRPLPTPVPSPMQERQPDRRLGASGVDLRRRAQVRRASRGDDQLATALALRDGERHHRTGQQRPEQVLSAGVDPQLLLNLGGIHAGRRCKWLEESGVLIQTAEAAVLPSPRGTAAIGGPAR